MPIVNTRHCNIPVVVQHDRAPEETCRLLAGTKMGEGFYTRRFRAGLSDPVKRFAGLLPYNFSGGHNDPELIPTDALVRASVAALKKYGSMLAIYNLGHGPLGYEGLRNVIASKVLRKRGIECSKDDILITSGSTQALQLLNQLFVQPGDTVIFEEFSYANAIRDLRQLGCRVVGVPLDAGGIRIDALETTLSDLRLQGIHPKFIYTMPTIQNPTGSILDLGRRWSLLKLAATFDIPIIEDECYSDLVWRGDAPPALYALESRYVIHVGSLSKSLAPALRVGFIVADWQVLSQAIALKTDGGTGALEQLVAAEYFSGDVSDHIPRVVKSLQGKLDTLADALHQEFGTTIEFLRPKRGTFLWAKLPSQIDVKRLVDPAARLGVAFNPGPNWACGKDEGNSHMRLCFALPKTDQIRRGVAELARVCFELYGIPKARLNVQRNSSAEQI